MLFLILFNAAMNVTIPLKQITLIGVGLIGGSFVLELKRLGLVKKIVGIDLSRENLNRALERNVIDEASEYIDEKSIADADLIVIATPVSALASVCDKLRPFLRKGVLVSDVGSTKQSTLATFSRCLPEHLPYCIAVHPIAGSDRSGALAAQFGLYQDKKLIITPHGQENLDALGLIEQLWQAVGAHTIQLTAKKHDEIFAAVSHMPHLLAFAFAHEIFDHPDGALYLQFAASGFRDFTRIASSHPAIWTDICMDNKRGLLDLIMGFQKQLLMLQSILEQGDKVALYRYFEEAKKTRDDWQEMQ